MTTAPDGPTALYRAFAADGSLLYAGIAAAPERRWVQHAAAKTWWRSEVATLTVEWHATRTGAERAESVAIATEAPRHNVDRNTRMVAPIALGDRVRSRGDTDPQRIEKGFATVVDFREHAGIRMAVLSVDGTQVKHPAHPRNLRALSGLVVAGVSLAEAQQRVIPDAVVLPRGRNERALALAELANEVGTSEAARRAGVSIAAVRHVGPLARALRAERVLAMAAAVPEGGDGG